jgi:hypothetical protein
VERLGRRGESVAPPTLGAGSKGEPFITKVRTKYFSITLEIQQEAIPLF